MGVLIIVKVVFGIIVSKKGDFHKKHFLETEYLLRWVPSIGDAICLNEIEYQVKERVFDFDDEVIRVYLEDAIFHTDEDYYEEIKRLEDGGWA